MYTNNDNKHTTELSLGPLPDSGRGLVNTTVTVPYKDSSARAACPDPGRMGRGREGGVEETMGRLPEGLAKARLTGAPSCLTRGWGHGGQQGSRIQRRPHDGPTRAVVQRRGL